MALLRRRMPCSYAGKPLVSLAARWAACAILLAYFLLASPVSAGATQPPEWLYMNTCIALKGIAVPLATRV
jgi:hypothetical protein